MKQLAEGILVGSLVTVAAITSGVLTFHKTVIKPVEEEEGKFDQNRRAATHKGRPAHQL